MTITITPEVITAANVNLRNGWPVTLCWKCGGTGYLPGYEHSDNARCWGCNVARAVVDTAATDAAKARVAARVKAGETLTDVVADEQARAIEEHVALLNKRAKKNAQAAARRAKKAAVEQAAKLAERDAEIAKLNAMLAEHPAAVDLTYFDNFIAAGADRFAVKGYEFAAERYVAGKDLTARMIEIVEETTAKLIGAAVVEPLTSGRQVLTGKVLSAKDEESTYGYHRTVTWKMTVELDGGQRVFGTVPAAVLDAYHAEGAYENGLRGWIKGRRVEFTATVEQSHTDETFGFFNRPTKAALVAVNA